MNNEKFEQLYNTIDEVMDITDDMFSKWIYDWEIAIDHETREEIEKEYGMSWWKVLNGDDDYNLEDNPEDNLEDNSKDNPNDNPNDNDEEDEKIVELKDWNTENFRYFKIIPSEKSKIELGLPDDFYYVVIVDLKKNKMTCDCMSGTVNNYCKHIREVAEKLKFNYQK
jgi:hypothetical protein